MSKKIAMIGAGSVVFCKTLMSDILAITSHISLESDPEFQETYIDNMVLNQYYW